MGIKIPKTHFWNSDTTAELVIWGIFNLNNLEKQIMG